VSIPRVRTILALSVLACLSASPQTLGQTSSSRSYVPSCSVSSFNIQQLNVIDALLQLGQEQRIPIGIEYIDAAAFRSRISLHEQDTTVGRLLDSITHGQGYSWFPNGGVIIVTRNGAPQGRKNLLRLRISEFKIAREVTLQAASLQLLGKLFFVLHPHATGIAGDYPSGNLQFRVGPWTMRNATIRQILNRIVSQHNNGAWVVQQAPWNMDKEPDYGLWRVIEYDGNNGAKYSNLLQVWGLGLYDPE
jgi:hypothetical protein